MGRYLIYGLSLCQYCVLACEYLDSRNIEYVFLNMDEDLIGIREAKEFYGHNTVPIILKNNLKTGYVKFIGGYDDLVESIEHE